MSKLMEVTTTIRDTWDKLSEKDQRTLLLAAPVVLVLALYLLVFQPIQSRYQEARLYKTELSNTLVWLYENAALVDRMQNTCTRQRLIEPEGEDVLNFAKNIGRRAGIKPDIRSANGSSHSDLMVSISEAPGNRALASVQSFACHGYQVSDLRLTRLSETASDVSLSFRLSPSGFLGGQ